MCIFCMLCILCNGQCALCLNVLHEHRGWWAVSISAGVQTAVLPRRRPGAAPVVVLVLVQWGNGAVLLVQPQNMERCNHCATTLDLMEKLGQNYSKQCDSKRPFCAPCLALLRVNASITLNQVKIALSTTFLWCLAFIISPAEYPIDIIQKSMLEWN